MLYHCLTHGDITTQDGRCPLCYAVQPQQSLPFPPRVPFVIIESPYAGNVERNVTYARAALWDSLFRGEAPFASHLLYTQVLLDEVPSMRVKGIEAGHSLYTKADVVAFYIDLGYSPGMELGRTRAKMFGIKTVERTL